VFAKLSELLFVEAVRRYIEKLPDGQTGWLAGLKDLYVSRALALLHARIRHPWTVDELGREIGLSRSALADRFIQVIGVPPMQYLTNWRMQVAAQELINSGKSIPQIADEVGYESEASLTRAFKRAMGAPPATWRRQQK
jgi:AraC-like DNA-binding protein